MSKINHLIITGYPVNEWFIRHDMIMSVAETDSLVAEPEQSVWWYYCPEEKDGGPSAATYKINLTFLNQLLSGVVRE
jgi:hypothetical protein